MVNDPIVSVIAPFRDAAGYLERFVDDLMPRLRELSADFELLLIDDGSGDGSPAAARRLMARHAGIRVLRLSRPFGYDVAASAGLETAIGDEVVVLDPLGDPPELVGRLVAGLRGGADRPGADAVVGVPHGGKARSPLVRPRRWLRGLAVRGVGRLLGAELPTHWTTCYAIRRPVVNAMLQVKLKWRDFRSLAFMIGCVPEYLPYVRSSPRRRPLLGRVGNVATLLITHSVLPIRCISALCLVASGLNLLYVGYVVAVYLLKASVAPGWTTLSLQISAMFLLTFVHLFLLGEYVARLMEESLVRPLYHVLDESCSDMKVYDPARRNVLAEGAADAA